MNRDRDPENLFRFNRHDAVLIAVIVLAVVLLLPFAAKQSGRKGSDIIIEADGRRIGRYSLSDPRTIRVKTKHGENVVRIRGGKAYMEKADCPDHYCMRQGKIGTAGQTLVCLPHRVVVKVVADGDGEDNGNITGEDDGLDAVAE